MVAVLKLFRLGPVCVFLLPTLALGCGAKNSDSASNTKTSTQPVLFVPETTTPKTEPSIPPNQEIRPGVAPSPTFPVVIPSHEVAPFPHEPGAQLPPPVPAVPAAQTDPKAEPKTDPKPMDMGTPITPKKYEYPKKIDDKDILKWLEIAEKDPDPQVRQNALNVIPNFGPDARKPSIRPLMRIVEADKDPGVRMAAITLLSVIGYEDKTEETLAISAIVSKLAQAQPGTLIRAYCIKSLTAFGPHAATPVAIGQLRNCLLDPSWETRMATVIALGSVGAPPPEDKRPSSGGSPVTPMPKDKSPFDPKGPNPIAIKALMEVALNDDCAMVRMEAAQSLIRIGQPRVTKPEEYAKAIEDYLKPINKKVNEKDEMGRANNLREKNPSVQAYLFLLQIMYNDQTKKENMTRLAGLMTNKDPLVRVNAITALSMLGPGGSSLVKEVTEALAAEELQVVVAAMQCLAGMGIDGGSAIPALEKIKNGSRDPKKPDDAPKDWKPDTTMRELAKDAIEYCAGRKKFGEAPPEPKKEDKKDPKAEVPK